MAWNKFSDICYYCKECSKYRVFEPFDESKKKRVLDELTSLAKYFEKEFEKTAENKEKHSEKILIDKKSHGFCKELIKECRKCDRSEDKVNRLFQAFK